MSGVPVWVPSAQDLRDELSSRVAIQDRALWPDRELDDRLERSAASLSAELPEVLPDRMHEAAGMYVLFSTAAQLEDALVPEQAREANSNAERLDRRAGAELARLRLALGTRSLAERPSGGFLTTSLSMGGR